MSDRTLVSRIARVFRRAILAGFICHFLLHFASARGESSVIGASLDGLPRRSFPPSSSVIDITKPPYRARGDGKTDDTRAIQQALRDTMGQRKILFFPRGTYLVSESLRWSKKDSRGLDAWGFNWIQGEDPVHTVIRLKDGVFTDPTKPRSIMWCGGFGSADWFHNYIEDITFDVGRRNPGAIGLQFYSNNMGAVRNLAIVSTDGRGSIGLDLAAQDMNGPLLVRNVLVKGFEIGIRTGASVNSQTFERVSLTGQSRCGFANRGQCLSIRGLSSENEVPALLAESFTLLLDSRLAGKGAAKSVSAIRTGKAGFYARNVTTSGYANSLEIDSDTRRLPDGLIAEHIEGKATSLFGAPASSLGLEIRGTPEVAWEDPSEWAVVDRFGADPTGEKDSSDAVQRAIDSGASTVFFPGSYNIQKPVRVRGRVRRILGSGGWLDYLGKSHPDLIVEDGDLGTVVIEHFAPINGGVELKTSRSVVLRSLETDLTLRSKGDLFLEDVATHNVQLQPGQRVWARQLDVENEGTHVTNPGAMLWVLGYKTERGGTLLRTIGGGKSEIFGNFSYTTTAGKLAPMFLTEDSSVFAFFNEVCYSGDPFSVLVRETRDQVTREVKRTEGGTAPYIARLKDRAGRALPEPAAQPAPGVRGR